MISSIECVDSVDFPGIEHYVTLKRPKKHHELGIVVVEGDKVVPLFFAAQYELVSILLTDEWFEMYREKLEMRPEPVQVYIAGKDLVRSIVGFNYHQGIMIVAKIPQELRLESAMEKAARPGLLVALDRLESAENTGAIVRNCAACGADALIVGETSTDPWLRRAVRSSMGTICHTRVVKSNYLAGTLKKLRDSFGYTIVAAYLGKESISLHDADFTKDICIVLGNEGCGIAPQILDVCDYAVKIPMIPGIDSFNVACASAILLYEANRQRSPGP